MNRYVVAFDDGVHEAPNPKAAVERAMDADAIPTGASVFVIDLAEAIDKGLVDRFRVGAEQMPLGELTGS